MDATQNYDNKLSLERLFGWHNSLFQSGFSINIKIDIGRFRSAGMKVVSGTFGREKVHFEAPAAERVIAEMEIFLDWLNNNNQIDLVLKSAISHFWFVTIHPFDDGNGRLARAIMDMLLARSDGSKIRFYSMSNQILKAHKHYNEIIEKTQKGTKDITQYLEWFLNCFKLALLSSEKNLEIILDKARFWEQHKFTQLNNRQLQIINHLYDSYNSEVGFLRTSTYAKITNCSTDTALRDLQDLVAKNIFKSEDSRKKTNYLINSPKNIRIPRITNIE
jgi:Fic family protein